MGETFRVLLALAGMLAVYSGRAPARGGQQPVIFQIPIARDLFTESATLDVQVWNAGQLAALSNNARCGIARDVTTGAEKITCPDGVTYQRVVPEQFRMPLQSDSIEVRPAGVKTGETFRIQLSAPSRDGCNTTSATLVRSARSGTNSLTDVVWQTTARACVK
jgi:hypothetical protein